jgi:hypothetical protein
MIIQFGVVWVVTTPYRNKKEFLTDKITKLKQGMTTPLIGC